MLSDDNLSSIETEGGRILELARKDPSRVVPQYPMWTMTDLVAHVASIHARTISICQTLPTERVAAPSPPTGRDVIDWYEQTLAEMVDTLRSVDSTTPAWGFGSSQTLGFWETRMLVETGIHRWDAEQAFEEVPAGLPAIVAVAGMDEFPDMWLPRLGELPAIRLVANDVGRSWVFGEGTPATTVTGDVSDIFLRLMSRPGVDLPEPWSLAVDGLGTPVA